MLYEQRTYRLKPGTTPAFFKVYEAKGLEVQKKILGNLVGYFFTDIGPLNTIVHIWAYESLDDRAKRRTALYQDPQWLEFAREGLKYIEHMESQIMVPAPFSPLQ